MPIEKRKFIYRADLRAEPNTLFVFGDNFVREGYGGQAREMRDEPNAVGIATKVLPSNAPHAFLTDDMLKKWVDHTRSDFIRLRDHLNAGGKVVWPEDGIGTGLADLERRAPAIWSSLQDMIAALESIA